jgi:hypothetical protein
VCNEKLVVKMKKKNSFFFFFEWVFIKTRKQLYTEKKTDPPRKEEHLIPLSILLINLWKMIQAQLKSNFSPTFLLSFKKETDVEERESLKLEREREI